MEPALQEALLPKYIAIEGPIGVGKTTLAHKIAETFNYDVFLEQPSDEGQRIVAEMDTWAFPIGFKVSENERIVLEDENQFVETKVYSKDKKSILI